MTQLDIELLLLEIVKEIQTQSGRPLDELSTESKPIGEVSGFDSLNGVEATIDACGRLGIDVSFNNVFLDDDKRSGALTVRQAALRLMPFVSQATTAL
jgi:acyl carrier protein